MNSEEKAMLNAVLEAIGKVQEQTTERFDSVDQRLASMRQRIKEMTT